MLKVTNHLRDANQNNNEVPPHTCLNDYHQQINKGQVLARMWRKRNPPALLVAMQTGAATVGNSMSMEFPNRNKMELPFVPVIPYILGIYPRI